MCSPEKENLRVLMVVANYPPPILGGLEKQARELSQALSTNYVKVTVISTLANRPQKLMQKDTNVTVYRIPSFKSKIIHYPFMAVSLFVIIAALKKRIDVIHIHQHSFFGLFAILVGFLFRKSTLTKLPNIGEYGIPGIKASWFGALKIRVLKMSDGIVAMSHESGLELQSIGYPQSQVFWVTNGLKITTTPIASKRTTNFQPVNVVFVGRLTEQKGLTTLIDAWDIVIKTLQYRVILEFWGDGPQRADLEQLVRIRRLESSIIFRGTVEKVRDKLHHMDIFVLPSKVEGNSNALLEAMAAGLPCIVTRAGGGPLLMGEQAKDWLVEIGDSTELAHKLITLIQDPYERQCLGEHLKHRANQYFDIDFVAWKYVKAYRLLDHNQNHKLGDSKSTWLSL